MNKEEKIICKAYLNDLDRTHDCNEYKLLMKLIEQEHCEDAVSRQAVFETIDDCHRAGFMSVFCSYDDGERFKKYIKNLPPVTPTRKKGKWIKSNIGGARVCSNCQAHMGLSNFKFCPNCGAEMESE